MTVLTKLRARVSPEAISKVTRIFNGTLDDIFNELFQNARRAGASHVAVTAEHLDDACLISVVDDGAGIADPVDLVCLDHHHRIRLRVLADRAVQPAPGGRRHFLGVVQIGQGAQLVRFQDTRRDDERSGTRTPTGFVNPGDRPQTTVVQGEFVGAQRRRAAHGRPRRPS